MLKKEKLFPAKTPAIVTVYGRFDHELETYVRSQVRTAFKQEQKPDGVILLIDSAGGSMRTLATFINGLLKLKIPVMGFVENEAMSAGAELLLSCQYRVATPFAKICFHHGWSEIDRLKIIDRDVCGFLVENQIAEEKNYIDRFCSATGQSEQVARVIYRADSPMPSSRALEFGVIHEITEEVFSHSFENE